MRFAVILLLLGLSACGGTRIVDPAAAPANGIVLMFAETRPPQGDTVGTRFLINESFVRIDEGAQAQDFTLFDRDKRTIYTVMAQPRTIQVIPYRQVGPPPANVRWQVSQEPSHALPRSLNGVQATYYVYSLNGHPCYHVVAVDNLLQEALRAIGEYRTALAGVAGANPTPANADTLCEAMTTIFEPTKILAHGFPVREWDGRGHQRFLMDYQVGVTLPKELFTLPQGYKRLRKP